MSPSPTPSTPDRDVPTPGADTNVGPETWVREAIAQQEEYLKRQRSCGGQPGRSHAYRTFGVPAPDGRIANTAMYQACVACGVTQTDDDYRIREQAQNPRQE